MVNDQLDALLFNAQDLMNSKGSARSENLAMELDELYGFDNPLLNVC